MLSARPIDAAVPQGEVHRIAPARWRPGIPLRVRRVPVRTQPSLTAARRLGKLTRDHDHEEDPEQREQVERGTP
ncbi:hypothetical protein Msi02_74520 [Microbispora siamensis]|uniref:Uncharacterized protein n=1 Tax=Microbispora siamensis TaxID=564413 RepID=A0ABQ4GYY9_9ACTN|nr:hypothetical protein Msi02_74520 [Microbispora siamensis]